MPKKGKVYFGDEEYKKETTSIFVKLFKKQHVNFDMDDDADDDGYMDEQALMQLTVLETGDSILKQAIRESKGQ